MHSITVAILLFATVCSVRGDGSSMFTESEFRRWRSNCENQRTGCANACGPPCCRKYQEYKCDGYRPYFPPTTTPAPEPITFPSEIIRIQLPELKRREADMLEINAKVGGDKVLDELEQPVEIEGLPFKLKLHDKGEMKRIIGKQQEIKRILAEKMGKEPSETDTDNIYYNGDTLLSDAQAERILEDLKSANKDRENRPRDLNRSKRKVLSDPGKLWENRTVNYIFDAVASRDYRVLEAVRAAANFWTEKTCLNVTEGLPVQGDDYLVFLRKGAIGCGSYKGRQGSSQPVHVGPGCENFGVMTHEIGHALGLYHEHQRPDRDAFIAIDYTNVAMHAIENFLPCTHSRDCYSDVPYDIGSVMHYHKLAFPIDMNRDTIIPVDSAMKNVLGTRRTGPTFYDVAQVNLAYSCVHYCSSIPVICRNKGFPNARTDCTTCVCPEGFNGPECEKVEEGKPEICGGELYAMEEWREVMSPHYPKYYPLGQRCSWLIKAPKNRRVELEFTGPMFGLVPSEPCEYDFVEVRWKRDLAATGARYCGTKVPDPKIVSEGRQMLILLRASDPEFAMEGFKAHFRIQIDALAKVSEPEEVKVHARPVLKDECRLMWKRRCLGTDGKCRLSIKGLLKDICIENCPPCATMVTQLAVLKTTTTPSLTTESELESEVSEEPSTEENFSEGPTTPQVTTTEAIATTTTKKPKNSRKNKKPKKASPKSEEDKICPGVWSYFKRSNTPKESWNGMCYKRFLFMNTKRRGWFDSKKICKSKGGELPAFENQRQIVTLSDYLLNFKQISRIWVGIRDRSKDLKAENETWTNGVKYPSFKGKWRRRRIGWYKNGKKGGCAFLETKYRRLKFTNCKDRTIVDEAGLICQLQI